jgi:hypothetical protein
MTWKTWATAISLGFGLTAAGPNAHASDRQDGSAASTLMSDPSSDIVDLFAWMESDSKRLFMVMTVFPNADKLNSRFSSTNLYVFHINARTGLADPSPGPEYDIICQFDGMTPQGVQCWAGTTEYVKGKLNTTLVSQTSGNQGKLVAFAGPRDDPFFESNTNLNTAITTIKTAYTAGVPAPNAAKCQAKNLALGAAAGPLNPNPAVPATDTYKGLNVLAIALSVDVSLLTEGGKEVLSVWASTNMPVGG